VKRHLLIVLSAVLTTACGGGGGNASTGSSSSSAATIAYDGVGAAARFSRPIGVAVDGAGNVYVADSGNNTIRKITSAGVVTTLAGTAGVTGSANGGGAAASFNSPQGAAVDGAGNIYVTDAFNSSIRKITSAGVVTTLAGGASGSADGVGAAAGFNTPIGVAVDGVGNVYVADTVNSAIRKITPVGVVMTLAGTPGFFYGAVDGIGAAASFFWPEGVTVDGADNVYVADTNNSTIRKITSAGVVTTLAGAAGASGSANGAGAAASFTFPQGVAVDGAGSLYVADTGNNTIRKISSAGVVTTLAGTAGISGSANGIGAAASFKLPGGVAVDGAGNVYVADTGNNTIRKITSAGFVTTLAGSAP
jgi:hypothetical protein